MSILQLTYKGCNLSVDWVRQRLFDHEAATMFLDLLRQHHQAVYVMPHDLQHWELSFCAIESIMCWRRFAVNHLPLH